MEISAQKTIKAGLTLVAAASIILAPAAAGGECRVMTGTEGSELVCRRPGSTDIRDFVPVMKLQRPELVRIETATDGLSLVTLGEADLFLTINELVLVAESAVLKRDEAVAKLEAANRARARERVITKTVIKEVEAGPSVWPYVVGGAVGVGVGVAVGVVLSVLAGGASL